MIYVIATVKIRPGSFDAVREAAMPCIEATREEPGCELYDMNLSVSNSQRLVFVERWKSRDDLEKHFSTPHMKKWRELAAPHIVERTIEIISPERVETL